MGNSNCETPRRVAVPPKKSFSASLSSTFKETIFPDDPFRQFKNQSPSRKFVLGLQYLVPIFEWAPRYTFEFFKADLIAGITIASLAVPQGISYAKLANVPAIQGLYSSFVPPLIYAMFGSSRDMAVGTNAVGSLLLSSMIGREINPTENPKIYLQAVFTATFFAGVIETCLGFLRLGFLVDFLSHAAIVGFMNGAAIIVCLQQLKGILGLVHFTLETDIVSVLRAVFTQTHQWRWESCVLGCVFLSFLILTKYYSKRKQAFFWINAMAPLTSVILGSILVYMTHAEKHGVQVIGHLKKGLNPPSVSELGFGSPYLMTAIKAGATIGIISLAVTISMLRLLLSLSRPRTYALGNIPNSITYRSIEQYPAAANVPGMLILRIDAPIYFANTSYLRERISRWIYEEEDRLKSAGETSLHYVILDMSAVSSIDASGIHMLEEVRKNVDRRGLQLALANPGSEVMKKLDKSKMIEKIGEEWMYLTVAEAVGACNFMLHSCKSTSAALTNPAAVEPNTYDYV
ncbi:hypothetical protein VitviT2T_006550 [Vitis vinifera]|uniref:STAS domain-containing protein n=1 Tax=Vitis vinifera TaxID=29760 RepID=A0ABY9BW48_VITVI|nr:hypothetical protein VitviT2T_006550 [Vitis vinifera]